MSEDLESGLRAALRPVAPRDALTRDIVARVATDAASRATRRPQRESRRRPRRRTSTWWLAASMAASLLIAIGVLHNLQERREQRVGLEARRQVI